jgi:hypothetical protein
MDNKSTVIGFVIYFWVFQISAFVMLRLFGLVSAESSAKQIIILFVIFGLAFTGFYFIKRSGDAKRAKRNATAQYDVARAGKKKKKKKR